MNRNVPKLLFTGFAVSAAGVFAALITGSVPESLRPHVDANSSEPAAQVQVEIPPNAATAEAPQKPTANATPEEQGTKIANVTPPEVTSSPTQEKEKNRVPTFDTIRVEKTGEAVIAGHAQPGSEVTIKFAGADIGKATANSEGSFVFVPEKPLPNGNGSLSLEATIDGQKVVSEEQLAVVVQQKEPPVIAKVNGEKPVEIVQSTPSEKDIKDVEISAVDYDELGNMIFQGHAPAGHVVRFYVDNVTVGDIQPDQAGAWLFKGNSQISPGAHTLRADEIDEHGKVVSRAETPFLRESPDTAVAALEAPKANATEPAKPSGDQTTPKSTPVQQSSESAVSKNPTEAVATLAAGRIVIQPGNNLWRISRQVYGKGNLYTVIWQANMGQVKNPNRVYPGQILSAPKT
jgi:nucleoid-associated protein YgaU